MRYMPIFKNTGIILTLTILICLVIIPACDELLPTRNDPTKLFHGKINTNYSLLWNENALRIGVTIVNVYDETIQANVVMEGTLDVSLVRDRTYHKTIKLNVNNLVSTKAYNSTKKELMLDPDDSIRFTYTWNFIDDNNVILPDQVFRYYKDLTCSGRYLAYSESFLITGSFRIIEKFDAVQINPIVANLCYVNVYYSAHDCPAPPTPCEKR